MGVDIFGIGALDEVHQKELIRKHLLNLTTSYSDESDVFTEIIQNAVDAITSRDPLSRTEDGQLTIVIGRRKGHAHYLYVQDNGVGMTSQLVDKVFIPGFSFGKNHGRRTLEAARVATDWGWPTLSWHKGRSDRGRRGGVSCPVPVISLLLSKSCVRGCHRETTAKSIPTNAPRVPPGAPAPPAICREGDEAAGDRPKIVTGV